jgi:hypothetical protein
MFHPSQMCSHFRHGAKVIPVSGPYGHFTSLCNDPDFYDFGVAGLDLYTVLLRREYDVLAALEAIGGQIGEQTATFHLERRLLSLCDMLDRSLFFNERHPAALHAPARQLVKVAHSAIEGAGMGVVRCDPLVAVDVRRAARLRCHTSRLSMSSWTKWPKHHWSISRRRKDFARVVSADACSGRRADICDARPAADRPSGRCAHAANRNNVVRQRAASAPRWLAPRTGTGAVERHGTRRVT